eukprot:9500403-Pyramimonas_sp.AAC.1
MLATLERLLRAQPVRLPLAAAPSHYCIMPMSRHVLIKTMVCRPPTMGLDSKFWAPLGNRGDAEPGSPHGTPMILRTDARGDRTW